MNVLDIQRALNQREPDLWMLRGPRTGVQRAVFWWDLQYRPNVEDGAKLETIATLRVDGGHPMGDVVAFEWPNHRAAATVSAFVIGGLVELTRDFEPMALVIDNG